MTRSSALLASPLLLLTLCGAGCATDLKSPSIAEPLTTATVTERIPERNGFGVLPPISVPTSTLRVTLATSVPAIPQRITVLRLKSGAPTDTQILNMAAALGVPGGTLGNKLPNRDAMLSWTDDQGIHWTYTASKRELTFTDPTKTLNRAIYPSTSIAISTANAFLQGRRIKTEVYRDPVYDPDGVVRYRLLIDGRDVMNGNGSYVSGAEVVVGSGPVFAAQGTITLPADPDRSDYPAISSDIASKLLLTGGLSGASGDVTVTQFEFASLALEDATTHETYLIPSLVGVGERARSDGTKGAFRIVVPLLAR